jgi:DNA-binding NarL/FixJ family response regulator
MDVIRILVADEHPVVLAGLRSAFADSSDIEVVGEARTTLDAIRKSLALQPEVFLCDAAMDDMHGSELIAEVLRQRPGARCIVFTACHTLEHVVHSLKAGALGLVSKTEELSVLPRIVRSVHDGQQYLSQCLVGALLASPARPVPNPGVAHMLTPREKRILELLAQDKSSKEVAAVLGISVRTVGSHRASIMKKLDIHSVTGLVRYALELSATNR